MRISTKVKLFLGELLFMLGFALLLVDFLFVIAWYAVFPNAGFDLTDPLLLAALVSAFTFFRLGGKVINKATTESFHQRYKPLYDLMTESVQNKEKEV
ncbi:hypothetical protein M1545_02945 [Patescibacteria group bacterium]|nr:hypothetical protein [Patescibacteria group bacterium]